MSAAIRNTVRSIARTVKPRAFHTPFAVLGNSPLTSPPPPTSNVSAVYEKQFEHLPEPYVTNPNGNRMYVVSQPDTTSKFYSVPSGAYPTSAPYVDFAATEAPDHNVQYSSTSSDPAHPYTTRAAPQHPGGIGESAAIRNASAPGAMGQRGGGYGGQGLMDREGTIQGVGKLAERNPPPIGSAAEQFSKKGVENAWKVRK